MKLFITQSDQYHHLSGRQCEIVRPLTTDEADLEETGPMFRIRVFGLDGRHITIDAFSDEIQEYRA